MIRWYLALIIAKVIGWRRSRRATPWAGATAGWSPLASIASQPVSANLVTEAMYAASDHQALHDIETAFRNDIDEYFAGLFQREPWLSTWFALDATGEIPLIMEYDIRSAYPDTVRA